MAKVITMEEREAGKKKRGFAKFKEDAKKVGKKVGKVLKKGGEAVVGLAKTALRDPAIRRVTKEAAISGLNWLAGHPLAGKLSYGTAKEAKPHIAKVVEAIDTTMGPSYFGAPANWTNGKATLPNSMRRPPTVPPKRVAPKIPTKSPASQKRPKADKASDELYV